MSHHNLAAFMTMLAQQNASLPRGSEPTVDDFATVLGLAGDGSRVLDEQERCQIVDNMIYQMQVISEAQQDRVYYKFGAAYLPALVDKLVNLPALGPALLSTPGGRMYSHVYGVKNAYGDMFIQLQHTPYFSKYLRSSHENAAAGKKLPEILASRLADLGPRLEAPGEMLRSPNLDEREALKDAVGDTCQLLGMLLTMYSREKDRVGLVRDSTKARLLPFLNAWAMRYPLHLLGSTADRTLAFLEESPSIMRKAHPIRKSVKGLEECGLPSCHAKTNLKACSRCATVRYCSPEHQKAHWTLPGEPHKAYCFRTNY